MIVGSQAILAARPDAPEPLRASPEIDAYPANAEVWKARYGIEASEEVNANFGYLSPFHEAHGFYIDGVDETTAMLPEDWRDRQILTRVECDGRIVHAITPEVHDLVVSKLRRLDPKDHEYVEALHLAGFLELDTLRSRITALKGPDETKARAVAFIDHVLAPVKRPTGR